MLKKIKFALWVVTFAAGSVASLSVVWSLVSGGLADAVRLFNLEDVAVVVACLVLVGPVGFTALSLERITGDRETMRALMDLLPDPEDVSPHQTEHEGRQSATATQKAAGRAREAKSSGDGGT